MLSIHKLLPVSLLVFFFSACSGSSSTNTAPVTTEEATEVGLAEEVPMQALTLMGSVGSDGLKQLLMEEKEDPSGALLSLKVMNPKTEELIREIAVGQEGEESLSTDGNFYIKVDPNSSGRNLLLIANFEQGQELKALVDLDPEDPEALSELSRIEISVKSTESALLLADLVQLSEAKDEEIAASHKEIQFFLNQESASEDSEKKEAISQDRQLVGAVKPLLRKAIVRKRDKKEKEGKKSEEGLQLGQSDTTLKEKLVRRIISRTDSMIDGPSRNTDRLDRLNRARLSRDMEKLQGKEFLLSKNGFLSLDGRGIGALTFLGELDNGKTLVYGAEVSGRWRPNTDPSGITGMSKGDVMGALARSAGQRMSDDSPFPSGNATYPQLVDITSNPKSGKTEYVWTAKNSEGKQVWWSETRRSGTAPNGGDVPPGVVPPLPPPTEERKKEQEEKKKQESCEKEHGAGADECGGSVEGEEGEGEEEGDCAAMQGGEDGGDCGGGGSGVTGDVARKLILSKGGCGPEMMGRDTCNGIVIITIGQAPSNPKDPQDCMGDADCNQGVQGDPGPINHDPGFVDPIEE